MAAAPPVQDIMISASGQRESSHAVQPRGWWDHPAAVAAAIVACMLPLLWPDIPPLVDLPGHMGRYRVQMEIDSAPHLRLWYGFEWALIGNLGVDLLVVPLSKLFGLELAVKLIVLSIPPLTAGGFLWVAREVHGRLPPTTYFAVPLAYNFPFAFGFVNFALSMAFAFLAFALWLRLARTGRFKLRAIVFVPLSLIIWVTHTFGWGTLGVMAFSAELVRQHDNGRTFFQSAVRAGVHCLAVAPPVLLMLLWRAGQVGGETGDWFNWGLKWDWLLMALRDRWRIFDVATLSALLLLVYMAIRSPRIEFSRNLVASALFLFLVFLILPRIVFGSAYADMRLAPYMIAVVVIAIRFKSAAPISFLRAFALAASLFLVIRLGATTVSYWMFDKAYDRELAVMPRIPYAARLISFVGTSCDRPWKMSRLEHLSAMALVRRRAFSNDQWATAGAQLLRVHYPVAKGWRSDPSEIVIERRCKGEPWRPVDEAFNNFPRAAFDYVWLINGPAINPAALRGLQPLWRQDNSVLYRVVDRTQPAPWPTPSE
ncbi:MAG TPA: hypothetical protein VGB48_01160 [Allosphingosinicella sp.]|jgi:hypothetical protein